MRSLLLLGLLFGSCLSLANNTSSLILGTGEYMVPKNTNHAQVIDLGPAKNQLSLSIAKSRSSVFNPLKLSLNDFSLLFTAGIQYEINFVNHTGSAAVLGFSTSYIQETWGAGLGCRATLGTSAVGTEVGRPLNSVRNSGTCYVQAFIFKRNTPDRLGLRLGGGKTQFRNVDDFDADHIEVSIFNEIPYDGYGLEAAYIRVEIPEQFRTDGSDDENDTLAFRIVKIL